MPVRKRKKVIVLSVLIVCIVGILLSLSFFILGLLQKTLPANEYTVEKGPFCLSLSGYCSEISLGDSIELTSKLENHSENTMSILRGQSAVYVSVTREHSPVNETATSIGTADQLLANGYKSSVNIFKPTEKGRYKVSVYAKFILTEDYSGTGITTDYDLDNRALVEMALDTLYIDVI